MRRELGDWKAVGEVFPMVMFPIFFPDQVEVGDVYDAGAAKYVVEKTKFDIPPINPYNS